MSRTSLEFRARLWIFVLIYTLGFVAPWNWALHLDGRGPDASTWGLLAMNLARASRITVGAAFNIVLALGTTCAFAGAWLRTWGSAYLGADAMLDPELRGSTVVADGPYRYLRNPLYLGTMGNTLALAMLMKTSGAVFTVLAVLLFQARLIVLEESFLTRQLGAAYTEYCRRVPRIVPALRPRVPASGAHARWLEAVLAEIYQWGMAVSFAAIGWTYNAGRMLQCVLVSVGVSLVVRAFPMRRRQPAPQI